LTEEAESVLQRLGLPPEFGLTLLVVCFALAVAPYFSGADFGIVKIPSFKSVVRRNLRFGGPIALIAVIFLHIPIFRSQPIVQLDYSESLATPIQESPLPAPTQPTPELDTPSEPRPPEEQLSLSPSNALSYKVNLLIPTSLSDATVWLDGHEALILRRSASLITIEVPADTRNHRIKVESEGSPPCVTTTIVSENDTTLTPCQD
jgi:hypothetical protein